MDQIIAEVGGEELNLPLLQHALQRTWELREGRPVMSANAYTAAGGVAKAINQAAQDCYDGLSAEEQAAAKRLFLRLVRPGEGNAHLRQRSPIPDDPVEQQVMDAFAAPDRRLLFIGMGSGRRGGGSGARGAGARLAIRYRGGWDNRERLRAPGCGAEWLRGAGTNAGADRRFAGATRPGACCMTPATCRWTMGCKH